MNIILESILMIHFYFLKKKVNDFKNECYVYEDVPASRSPEWHVVFLSSLLRITNGSTDFNQIRYAWKFWHCIGLFFTIFNNSKFVDSCYYKIYIQKYDFLKITINDFHNICFQVLVLWPERRRIIRHLFTNAESLAICRKP